MLAMEGFVKFVVFAKDDTENLATIVMGNMRNHAHIATQTIKKNVRSVMGTIHAFAPSVKVTISFCARYVMEVESFIRIIMIT